MLLNTVLLAVFGGGTSKTLHRAPSVRWSNNRPAHQCRKRVHVSSRATFKQFQIGRRIYLVAVRGTCRQTWQAQFLHTGITSKSYSHLAAIFADGGWNKNKNFAVNNKNFDVSEYEWGCMFKYGYVRHASRVPLSSSTNVAARWCRLRSLREIKQNEKENERKRKRKRKRKRNENECCHEWVSEWWWWWESI